MSDGLVDVRYIVVSVKVEPFGLSDNTYKVVLSTFIREISNEWLPRGKCVLVVPSLEALRWWADRIGTIVSLTGASVETP